MAQVLHDVEEANARQLMLTEKDPVRRLAGFLYERAPTDRQLELPVSRQDVADYLGVTHETVARCFTKLRRRGVIRLSGRLGRSVQIIDREAIAELSIG